MVVVAVVVVVFVGGVSLVSRVAVVVSLVPRVAVVVFVGGGCCWLRLGLCVRLLVIEV